MEHEDEYERRPPAPEGPQSVWQSLHRREDPRMEMKLTTDQLCTKARYRERENVVGQWIAAVTCLGGSAAFVYLAITMEQIWLRLGNTWMALLMAFAFWGVIRQSPRRIQAGESCAQFMVRELDGSRRTLLGIRWVIILAVPSVLMSWWGGYGTIPASALHLDPSSWPYHFLTSPWRIVAVLLVLFAGWAGLGLEVRKRARHAEELRRAIGARE
jgi:hypothetical protein